MKIAKVLTLAVGLIAVLALAVPLGAQTRPSFVGKWLLVVEKSTAPHARHHQEITIAQDARTITLAQRNSIVAMPMGDRSQPPNFETWDLQYSETYEFDGAEHPDTPHPPAATSTYRAVWTRDQLVIVTRTMRTMTPTNGAAYSSTSVVRKALSIDPEGLLVVDNITIAEPMPNGPTQPAPVPVRSVYRKAS